MKLQYSNRKRRSRIDLRSDERCPLGISVTESQKGTERPTIKNIKHGSIAHKSHCLAESDVILSINDQDTQSMRKKDVKRLFKDNQLVTIEVEYFYREARCSKVLCSQRTSLTLKKENGSFGFVVRKDVTEYPLISNIKRDGPADKHGSMMAGDRLLEVDSQSLSGVPLTEVATLLQEQDEAVFLIEYNVGIISFSRKEVEIEIDCTDANIGMTVNTFVSDLSRMYIATLQQGGLTQRCGAFQVGDEILSIDNIEVKTLTTSKVNDLLRRLKKKPGKLKFVHSREITSQENLSGNNSKTESTADFGVEQDLYGELSPGNDAYQTISLNSHSSSEFAFTSSNNSLTENNFFHKVAYNTVFHSNQLKTLSFVQCINRNIANLQLSLSRYDRNSARLDRDNRQADVIGHREVNPRSGETENEFSRLKTECLATRNLIRDLSFHCIKSIAQLELCQNETCSHSIESQESNSNKLPNTGRLVVELIYHLNEIAAYNFVPMTSMEKFISAINKTDTNCCICRERCYLTLFAVRKVLLLLSLNEKTSQTTSLVREVLNKVTEICIPCEECKISLSTNIEAKPSYGQFCLPSRLGTSSFPSSKSNISQQASSVRTKRCETVCEPPVGLDVAHQKAIYRLTEVPSSENSYSTTTGDNFSDVQRHSYPLYSNMAVFHSAASNKQNGSKFRGANSSKLFHDNHQEKEQSARTMNSCWESTEIVSNPSEELEQKFPSVIYTTPKFPTPVLACSNQRATNKCSFGFELTKEQPYNADPNTRPKSTAIEIEDESNDLTHTDTHNVTLKSDGGYGLILGYDCIPRPGTARIPIITSIRPNSSSERKGLLKIGDRILAINGQSTINFTVADLETLKREAFALEEITLNVEFDVNEPIVKYGTFEINLEENLKVGLVMHEPNNIPCKVKGLVKGGSAHRSGQVFPGDIVLSFGSNKHETLDLLSQTKTKRKTFHLVVRRELDNSESKQPEYVCDPASLVRKGTGFNLKRTSVRTMEGCEDSDTVFLEQEFTLFRDPITWDFGFLFGEDPSTGRAYITGIRPNSPADISKAIKQNDRIIEVNGVLIDGSRENSVMRLIMNASDDITLVTRRIIHYR